MFDLIKDIIGYSGTTYNNLDSYLLYTCITLLLLGSVVTIDLLYKLFLRFLPGDSK